MISTDVTIHVAYFGLAVRAHRGNTVDEDVAAN